MKSWKQKIKSGVEWEARVGYSRAIKAGNHIFVSGTTAVDEQAEIVGRDDVYLQTKQCILNIEKALKQAGASLNDVVRTRSFITDIKEWEKFARAHKEHFYGIEPASSLLEITQLIHPDLLIEIEAEAILPSSQ